VAAQTNPMIIDARRGCLVAAGLLSALLGACVRQNDHSWDQRAAAAYLDNREGWWASWRPAALDENTFCVSCHTALPYALARPGLSDALAEPGLVAQQRKLLDNVTQRVRLWSSIQPYYSQQAPAARGTEAVLNALILASNDAHQGHLSADTKAAFDHMWAEQLASGNDAGAWAWIRFNNEPWEAFDSAYYGATLAALAVGLAPENYRSLPEIQEPLARLRQYLDREYASQSALGGIELLWASAHLPGLLDPDRRQSIVDNIWKHQHPDGGWAAASFMGDWKRRDGTPLPEQSDGYATGLITLALQQIGVSADDPRLARGLSWLLSNQSWWNGRWVAHSLNQWRNPFRKGASQFMDDAATAYAVLALTQRQVNERLMSARSLSSP
jgi:squalene-hopene/tetraprenyl-beta-curcumene cyclase